MTAFSEPKRYRLIRDRRGARLRPGASFIGSLPGCQFIWLLANHHVDLSRFRRECQPKRVKAYFGPALRTSNSERSKETSRPAVSNIETQRDAAGQSCLKSSPHRTTPVSRSTGLDSFYPARCSTRLEDIGSRGNGRQPSARRPIFKAASFVRKESPRRTPLIHVPKPLPILDLPVLGVGTKSGRIGEARAITYILHLMIALALVSCPSR